MRDYHVSFWSGERAHVVGCDIAAQDDRELLDGLARAGRYSVGLRRKALPMAGEHLPAGPTVVELAWVAGACGPIWLFVAASYWFG